MSASRRIVHRILDRIVGGEITVAEGASERTFGRQLPNLEPLRARITVHDESAYRQLLRGSTGLAASYMDGWWETDDLVALVRIAARDAPRYDRMRERLHPLLHLGQRLPRWLRRNSIEGSRHNIAAHYDLGNDLFGTFLDETMTYSSAVFERPDMTLAEAQLAKLDRIGRKLALTPADHLLEIGTGWGALAIHMAQRFGCRVTTTTISKEQHALAVERVRDAGLDDRIEVLLRDYRELEGRYDKVVSVEMIEAVGWQYFPTYFERLAHLVTDDGVVLLQAITIDGAAYESEKASRSFINTYIFPGGCLPSVEVIDRCAARAGLRPVQLEDITMHYATTLSMWRERFLAAQDELEARGYDERFRRMWNLYLAYCEAGFRERRIQDVQVLLAAPGHRAEPLFVIEGGREDGLPALSAAG